MTDLKAIIFDCDGVLFESHRANLAYYNRIFSEFDYPLIDDHLSPEAHICHTASSPMVLAELMRESDVAAALLFAQTIDYREFIPLMIESCGLKSALTRLSEKFPLAVATNRGSSMQELLTHFELAQFFKVIVTSRDVERPKPAPDMLLLAARQLGTSPGDCLFIGDSELDRLAATEVSMPFVAFGETLKIERRVNTHTELAQLLLDGEV
jgi:HAD superfamily hydrolase (TIGR01549 family)